MNTVLVSVLMGIYHKDDPRYLKAAIESVLVQSHREIEFVIVTDGSITDELKSIINECAELDSRIVVIRLQKNYNFPQVLNIGIIKLLVVIP